jgi:large subunit ribosomal protein L15
VVINLDVLGAAFEAGAVITPDVLRERGLVSSSHRKPVKVLGRGELSIALTVQADKFSGKAAEKIAAAGGKAETVGAAAQA